LQLGSCRVCRDEFDGGFLSFWPAVLGEVHRAMVRAAQILSQREFPGDDPAFPLVPRLGHIAPRFAARVSLRGCIRVPRPGYIEERAPQVSSRILIQYPLNQTPARLGTLLSGFRRSRLGLGFYQRRNAKY